MFFFFPPLSSKSNPKKKYIAPTNIIPRDVTLMIACEMCTRLSLAVNNDPETIEIASAMLLLDARTKSSVARKDWTNPRCVKTDNVSDGKTIGKVHLNSIKIKAKWNNETYNLKIHTEE